MKLKTAFKLLVSLNLLKTIYFNLKYFPLKTALRLPVFIYQKTSLHKLQGRIVLNVPPTTGLVQISAKGMGIQDSKYSRTIWDVNGTLIISGKTNLGRGCRINIEKEGSLTIGHDFSITGDSTIICQKEITFGHNCLLSWDVLIMDTDFHHIINQSGDIVNVPCPIHIGNHVWIGCRSTILKGVTIHDDVIISANSTITKSIAEDHCAIGGSGKNVTILKRQINWKM